MNLWFFFHQLFKNFIVIFFISCFMKLFGEQMRPGSLFYYLIKTFTVNIYIYIYKIKHDHMHPLFPALPVVSPTPPLPPNFIPFFFNTLNPVSLAHMCIGVRPPMGVWGTHQRSQPERRKSLPPQQLPNANSFLERAGPEIIFHLCRILVGLMPRSRSGCFLS